MENKITEPLRLAKGNHKAGSGKGCAMNVISWENGDTQITDIPSCADPFLARIVQKVNDNICHHTKDDLLCPECSTIVLGMAHKIVGTSGVVDDLNVYVQIARVAAAVTADADAVAAYAAAAAYAYAAYAAYAAAYAYAAYAAAAAADAAYAAAAAAYAAYAYDADADAAAAAYAADLIKYLDMWFEITGHTPAAPPKNDVTQIAIDKMMEVPI